MCFDIIVCQRCCCPLQGCRTQVHVVKAGGLGCKEMETGEEVKCQRLLPLTLLQQSVIHETTLSPSLPHTMEGGI